MTAPHARHAAVLVGLGVVALGVGVYAHGHSQGPAADAASTGRDADPQVPHAVASPKPLDDERARVRERLQRVVATAGRRGGTVSAAVMLGDWTTPVAASSDATASRAAVRMWSVSKVVTAVALLRELGWGEHPGTEPSSEVRSALQGALRRSENCRQRRVLLALQELVGSPAAAADAVAGVLADAGAHPLLSRRTQSPDAMCVGYLQRQLEVREPLAPALLLGTSRWRVGDAVRFANALGRERFGAAITHKILAIMRQPKLRSREAPRADFTAALDWGAGGALRCAHPAYKAGWGGAVDRRFVAEQIAIVGHGRRSASIAVIFRPATQPPRDDPGLTAAPEAIGLVMRRMASELTRGRCRD